jgi:hypothetical protein
LIDASWFNTTPQFTFCQALFRPNDEFHYLFGFVFRSPTSDEPLNTLIESVLRVVNINLAPTVNRARLKLRAVSL